MATVPKSLIFLTLGYGFGHGAVLASSAVVTKDDAPYTIVTGIPAKPMPARFAPQIAERLLVLG